jgi:class 3 adenylate cyclase/tetratricopeptide (TPR) repeat protein
MGISTGLFGERRQLTVVFVDLVGSTGLSFELDPEDYHDLVRQYHMAAKSVVERFEGFIAQIQGDGILILFSYPVAHENDAERAIRAGLALLEEMKSLNPSLEGAYGKRLAVRVGIHTGEVMVRREEGDTGNYIYGETPNIAARVQSAAEPNSVCITEATQRLVAGFFVVKELGPHVLKGVPDPIRLYRVEQMTGVRSRLHAAANSSLSPFVGREDERNLLMTRWTQVKRGKGQLVMITGEAGIGKSRLLQQFKADLGEIPHTWVEGESSPYEQDTPFAPTLDLVNNAFQWTEETTSEEKIDALERSFSLVGMNFAISVQLMATLLGLSVPPDRYPPLLLSPEQQRLQLLQTLVDWVMGTARLQPTVLVIEDLQFADPSTLEEFVMLSEQVENTPLMLLFTARPRFQPPWPTRLYHTILALNRLDREDTLALIEGLSGSQLPKETVESLARRADGIPLFAEELSYAAAVTQTTSRMHHIPATLQDLLMTRLDHLGPAKEIAQIGSVVGREFSKSLLSSVSGKPELEIDEVLAHLVASGLFLEKTSSADTVFTFKHALVQEVAYGSLLKSYRRQLHASVAKALNENFSEISRQRPELVAHHLTEAGKAEQAIEAWQNAGEFATSRAALMEANQHYTKALDILNSLPDTPDRAQLELPLQISLGQINSAIKGFGSTEEDQAFSRARQIAEQLDDSPQFFFILLGLWSTKNSRSEITASRKLADEMLRIADRDGVPLLQVWANFTIALEAYAVGNFADVGEYVERVQAFYREDDHTWAPFDPYVTVLGHASYALWQLGFVEQALEKTRFQLELAKKISPANVAMARMTVCNLAMYLEDADALMGAAQDMLDIGEEQQLPSFLAWGTMYKGIALILGESYAEGISLLTKGIGDYLETGTHSSLGWYLSRLAIGFARSGKVDLALKTIADAFGAAPDETMHLPELYRLRGDFLLQNGDPDDLEAIEQDYRQALAISKQFKALAQELRAATRLANLMHSQGRVQEAHALLAPVYDRFSEGFETKDLAAARNLLKFTSSSSADSGAHKSN